jgi:hypothetical protein
VGRRRADTFLDRWIVVIGAILVLGTGLAYMFIAKPYDHSEGSPRATRSRSRPNCGASASRLNHAPFRWGIAHLLRALAAPASIFAERAESVSASR